MKWSSEKPIVPGWYWWRWKPNSKPLIYTVWDDMGWWRMSCFTGNIAESKDVETCGHWSGPLTPPEEG